MGFKMITDDIELSLEIRGWKPPTKENRSSDWCKCDLRVKVGDYLDYSVLDDEFLEFPEVVHLAACLEKLLCDKYSGNEFVCFTEPDLSFELHPKSMLGSEELDVCAELMIALRRPDTNYNGAVLTLPFERGDIKSLLGYLKEAMNV